MNHNLKLFTQNFAKSDSLHFAQLLTREGFKELLEMDSDSENYITTRQEALPQIMRLCGVKEIPILVPKTNNLKDNWISITYTESSGSGTDVISEKETVILEEEITREEAEKKFWDNKNIFILIRPTHKLAQ